MTFLRHGPCEVCGSSDAKAHYEDGHTYCFSCGGYAKAGLIYPLSFPAKGLPDRGISGATLRLWGYGLDSDSNQIATYYSKSGDPIAQKIRSPRKEFRWVGKGSVMPYGFHLYSGSGRGEVGLAITEGELDALAVSEAQAKFGKRWPVVSVPNGAQGAKKDLARALEWIESFKKVVLMFDMDEPGRRAARECAELFKPGTVFIAQLPAKDPNQVLLEKGARVLQDAYWNAAPYKPDELLTGDEVLEIMEQPAPPSVLYPFEALNSKTHGFRRGEIIVFAAGTGTGKSTIIREIAWYLLTLGEKVGYVALEEGTRFSGLSLLSVGANRKLVLENQLTEEDKALWHEVAGENLVLYKHQGAVHISSLLSKFRHMVMGYGCKYLFLDHISMSLSALDVKDERRYIDRMMAELRAFVDETDCALFAVSHLSRDQRAHEEGGHVALKHLRHSHGVAQVANTVIALERNQQDLDSQNIVTIRVLKNRLTGETGVSGYLRYDPETGRLVNHVPEFEECLADV